jgi:hypothetical protein
MKDGTKLIVTIDGKELECIKENSITFENHNPFQEIEDRIVEDLMTVKAELIQEAKLSLFKHTKGILSFDVFPKDDGYRISFDLETRKYVSLLYGAARFIDLTDYEEFNFEVKQTS